MPLAMTIFLKLLEEDPWEPHPEELQHLVLKKLEHDSVIPKEAFCVSPLPFTLSPPLLVEQTLPSYRENTPPGTKRASIPKRVRIRVSWLEDARLENFLSWAQKTELQPLAWEQDGHNIHLEGVLVTPTPADRWNRSLSYEQLFEEASNSLRMITLKFYSPTLLHRQGVPYPLPDPKGVFQHYLCLWNHFSGIPQGPDLLSIMEKELLLRDFRLRARPKGETAGWRTYFSGSATFQLKGRHPETVLKAVNTLADYAFFCGTGIATEKGGGMTRRILKEKGDHRKNDQIPAFSGENKGVRRDQN